MSSQENGNNMKEIEIKKMNSKFDIYDLIERLYITKL